MSLTNLPSSFGQLVPERGESCCFTYKVAIGYEMSMNSRNIAFPSYLLLSSQFKIDNQYVRKLRRIDRTYFCSSRQTDAPFACVVTIETRTISAVVCLSSPIPSQLPQERIIMPLHLCPLSTQTPSSVPNTLSLLP
jgi:hypothetical protein